MSRSFIIDRIEGSFAVTESNDGSVPKFIENRLKLNSKKDFVTVTDHFSIVRA